MSAPLTPDAVVVGGGPAGLGAAIALRLRGARVRVFEAGRPPIDKACGEGLMPDGVGVIERWGVEVGGWPMSGIEYHDEEAVAAAPFPSRCGRGLRRTALHAALTDRAVALGVEIDWGTRVRGLGDDGVVLDAGPVSARWVVGADGLRSRVRGWSGLDRPARGRSRFGVRRHYRTRSWTDRVEVHWAQGAEAYVTPVAVDEVGVALLWSGGKASFDRLLPRFPRLAARLDGATVTSRDRGAGPLRQRVLDVVRGRVVLVGDAAGYVDAITGEGLALAFHEADALAEAISRGDVRSYRRSSRTIRRRPELLTHLLLWVRRRPAVRRELIRVLARDSDLFAELLAYHVGERRTIDLPWPRLVARLPRFAPALLRSGELRGGG